MKKLHLAFLCLCLAAGSAFAEDYTFTVENNSDQDIVTIEVSEDGYTWEYFNIGRGIRADSSELLAWDESTNNRGCDWRFRATFEEGYVAYADWIDFCEPDVVVYFDF